MGVGAEKKRIRVLMLMLMLMLVLVLVLCCAGPYNPKPLALNPNSPGCGW